MVRDEGYWDDEKLLEEELGKLMVKMKQRTWRDIEGVFQQLTFDMAYFKVHLTLKLVVEGGNDIQIRLSWSTRPTNLLRGDRFWRRGIAGQTTSLRQRSRISRRLCLAVRFTLSSSKPSSVRSGGPWGTRRSA